MILRAPMMVARATRGATRIFARSERVGNVPKFASEMGSVASVAESVTMRADRSSRKFGIFSVHDSSISRKMMSHQTAMNESWKLTS